MKVKHFTKAILIFSICFLFFKANAQWSTNVTIDNNLNYTTYGVGASYCSDGHGGVIYTWLDQTANINSVRANRIDSLGFIRWGNTGISVNPNVGDYNYPVVCDDGMGGCYIAYDITNISYSPLFCQHLDSSGNVLWPGAGTQLFSHTNMYQLNQASPTLVNDNGNGVFAVGIYGVLGGSSDVLAQRLDTQGAIQWPAGGVFIDSLWDERSPMAIADGNNGITMIWFELTYGSSNLKMQRLNHSGVPQFAGGNKYLRGNAPFDSYSNYSIIRTTNNDYIASWIGSYSGGGSLGNPVFSQKLDASGTSLWSGNALTVCDTASGKTSLNVISDGQDGAYYSWADGRNVHVAAYGAFAQQVTAAGAIKWGNQGLVIDSIISNSASNISLAPDINNGIKIFYVDEATGSNQVAMQILDNTGAKQLPGIGTLVTAAGHPVYGNVAVSNNHTILMLSNGFAKYVPFDNSILAVNFTSFKALLINRQVQLTWQTTNEINNTGFDIERSNDNMQFSKLAFEPAVNKNQQVNNYSFVDNNPFDGDNFYRLKQIDNDGKFTYSIINKIELREASSLQIYPNPAVTQANIQFQLSHPSHTIIVMYDINGREVKAILNTNLEQGVHTLSVSTTNLTKGIYFIKLSTDKGTESRKLIVE